MPWLEYIVHLFSKTGCSPVVFPWQFELPIYAPTTYYEDTDFDGFGNPASPFLVVCAASPFGYSLFSTDCNDSNPTVYPGAPENCSDKDYNCDGMITGTNPAPIWYRDFDMDGYGNAAISITNCNPLVGYVGPNNDCNDNNAFIHPLALEACNNIDDDCDGLIDEDFPPTTVTFNGSVDSDWFNTANWTPAMVPGYCVDVVIPAGMMVTAGGVGMTATCRSMSIAATSSVSVNDDVQLNITGGTMFGISNAGTLNLNNDSYTNIQYINGNGVDNSNTIIMSGNAILYISVTSQSSIRNQPGGTITINSNNGLDMNAATENAIFNSGTCNRNGAFNANNISGSTIKNTGTFNNQGDLFINAFGLPGWFVENLSGGIINNNAGQTWTFPIPGSFYNV
ncbi:MAG: putative metal-binding motif-containing protein [Saprospiraceae bacterium]|nr:putative metal-binding motif-containing protein [Saprospiraceae bacterium]